MNGQLSDHPLAELIHEISAKSLSGRLQLQHDRVKAALYFGEGAVLYAASNARNLRLREYLLKAGIAEGALVRYEGRLSDLELAKALCADQVLVPARAEQIQAKQLTDIVRLALSWLEGSWDFDPRARLDGAPILKLDMCPLLLEAARHAAPKLAAARFDNPAELISPAADALTADNLLPAEGFILSRLDCPTVLKDLLAVCGVSQSEALSHLYALAVAGLVQTGNAKYVLGAKAIVRATTPAQPKTAPAPAESPPPPPAEEKRDELADAHSFLEQLGKAQTHYDVLDVSRESTADQMKLRYYELARRYHPDRFRRAEATFVRRLESAFARVTQAYDTLRDDRLRAHYDSKLAARQKAQQLAELAPKPTAPIAEKAVSSTETPATEPKVSIAERAEQQFKEGYAAFESGQKKLALGLFASASNAVPKEARYRAFYGRVLAEHEETRRAAETELQAAVKLDPQNGEYRLLLAELYRDLGLMLRARGEAERAIAADPNNHKARDLLRALKSV